MAGESPVKVSSTTFFDLPFVDVIVRHIAQYLDDEDFLAMWMAFGDTFEGIFSAKRHLSVSEKFPDREIFPIAAKTCHQLRSFHIDYYKMRQYWNKPLAQLVANNPLISELSITCGTWKRFLKTFTNAQISLHHVTVKGVVVKDEVLAAFFEVQPFLRSIKLAHLNIHFQKTLLAIGRTCHELEKIDMTRCSGVVDNDGVREIAENCPRLRTFLIPEVTMNIMRVGLMLLSKETIDLLLARNIAFCDEDDPFLTLDLTQLWEYWVRMIRLTRRR